MGASDFKAGYIWTMNELADDKPDLPSKREEEDLQILENLVATTQNKFDITRKKFEGKKQDRTGMMTRSMD